MSSLALLLLARPLARMIALGEEGLATLGVNLVIFSVILFFVSTRRAMARTLTLVVILGIAVADIGWVLASLLLAALPSYTTPIGRMLVLGTAAIVAIFGILQGYAGHPTALESTRRAKGRFDKKACQVGLAPDVGHAINAAPARRLFNSRHSDTGAARKRLHRGACRNRSHAPAANR